MLTHLRAVADALSGLTVAPYGFEVALLAGRINEGARLLVLSVPAMGDPLDDAVCGTSAAFVVDLRIKAVASSAEATLPMLALAQGVLSPDGRLTTLTVPGRAVSVRWVRSEFADVDPSVTFRDGSHPGVGVDTYRLDSAPF